jgi:hypothetical protein
MALFPEIHLYKKSQDFTINLSSTMFTLQLVWLVLSLALALGAFLGIIRPEFLSLY